MTVGLAHSTYYTALAGMHRAHAMALSAATQVASGRLDTLADSMVTMMAATHAHRANLAVVIAQDEVERHLLDILA